MVAAYKDNVTHDADVEGSLGLHKSLSWCEGKDFCEACHSFYIPNKISNGRLGLHATATLPTRS